MFSGIFNSNKDKAKKSEKEVANIPTQNDESPMEEDTNSAENIEMTPEVFVRAEGLPKDVTARQVRDFFGDCEIDGKVVFDKNEVERPTKSATVKMKDETEVEKALKHHKTYLGQHYIIVEKGTKEDYTKNDDGLPEPDEVLQVSVKLSGLDWNASENDIRNFFNDCNVSSVLIINNDKGKPSGEALVKLDEKDLEKALAHHKENLGKRWVAVAKCDDIVDDDHENTEAFIKLGSLEWSKNENDIANFLHDCNVTEVVITTNERGKPSGNAYARLKSKRDVPTALKHHKEYLGKRWVDVSEVSHREYTKETKGEKVIKFDMNAPKKSSEPFAKLGGLSWKATEEDIYKFFKDCKVEDVVITKNERGKPSGEAFVRFESADDLEKAKKHNKEYIHDRWVIVEGIDQSTFNKATKVEEEEQDFSGSHVLVKNLPLTTSEDGVKKLLKDCKTKEVIMLEDKPGNLIGEALVEVATEDDLIRAMVCQNSTMEGRVISVDKVLNGDVGILRGMNHARTIRFYVEIKKEAHVEDVIEECKDIDLDGIVWEKARYHPGFQTKFWLDCTVTRNEDEERIKRELEKVDSVIAVNTGSDNTTTSIAFMVEPWDDVTDVDKVESDCKEIEYEGLVWGESERIAVSESKSKIKLHCTLKSEKSKVEEIRKLLEEVKGVDDVQIIDQTILK